jgi:hypothetical protein
MDDGNSWQLSRSFTLVAGGLRSVLLWMSLAKTRNVSEWMIEKNVKVKRKHKNKTKQAEKCVL